MTKHIMFFLPIVGSLVFPVFSFGQLSHTAPTPNIGRAQNFAIFTGCGAINSNSTIATNVLGDIGTGSGAVTGFIAANTSGVVHNGDPLKVGASIYICATHDSMLILSNTTSTYSPYVISTIGNNQVFIPGVYFLGAAATLNGTLTLDAQGDTNAIFIILIGGAFGTAANSVVILTNKATPSHVYWWVDGGAVVYVNTTFQGSIIVSGALTINDSTSIKGRALVTTGAVHLVGSNIQGAAQIDSIATVVAIIASTITMPVKAYLQGALNSTSTGLSTTLFNNNLVPLAQPYSGKPFNHVSTSSEAALTVIPAGVIDWALVELLDQNNDTVVASRAVFIGSDGNIIDVDGTPGVKFLGANVPSGVNYNLGIRHRNHFSVRTATSISFAAGVNTNSQIDFTNVPNGNLYTNPTITTNAPMVLINCAYAMWAGDIDNDGIVSYTGRGNNSGFLLNNILGGNINNEVGTYNNGDMNFQGKATFTGRSSSDGYLLNSLLSGNLGRIIYQHY